MRTSFPARYLLIVLLFSVSCKKENSSDNSKIDKSLIYGWWYNDETRSEHSEYKGRLFNQDGTTIADATNYGLGIGNYGGGTWKWSGDTLLFSGAGTVKAFVRRLSTDSMYYDLIDADGPNTRSRMYYHR
jgi:hypothetical protein